MSWSINNTVNTVLVSRTCAKELFKAQNEEVWYSLDEVTHNGRLSFNPDHAEWMDWLANQDALVEILKKYRVKGDICFGSSEGDNAGKFWGYSFDGLGGMTELVGRVVYEEKHTPFASMTFVITGVIAGMTRAEAYEKIRELGGKTSDSVSRNVTHLIVGKNPGSNLAKAKKFDIAILNETQFSSMLIHNTAE